MCNMVLSLFFLAICMSNYVILFLGTFFLNQTIFDSCRAWKRQGKRPWTWSGFQIRWSCAGCCLSARQGIKSWLLKVLNACSLILGKRKKKEEVLDFTNEFLGILVIVSYCTLCGGLVFVV